MKIKTKKVYISEDGKEFDTIEECQKYEKKSSLEVFLRQQKDFVYRRNSKKKMTLDDLKVSIKENVEKIKNLVEKLNS